jgi:hypothetical protein
MWFPEQVCRAGNKDEMSWGFGHDANESWSVSHIIVSSQSGGSSPKTKFESNNFVWNNVRR